MRGHQAGSDCRRRLRGPQVRQERGRADAPIARSAPPGAAAPWPRGDQSARRPGTCLAIRGSRGLHALERCAGPRSRRSRASARAAISWSSGGLLACRRYDSAHWPLLTMDRQPSVVLSLVLAAHATPYVPQLWAQLPRSRIAHPPSRVQRRASRITVKAGRSHRWVSGSGGTNEGSG